ncbi:Haloacid dehalogenase/epoxide hydrolase [Corchorus capsularis]|uniref:Haloacid dehalogenase/epoxide hydrolase n=1 Tax=Corchorus capsularis TaxID=210143 RepID=A0A1R3GDF1_COCAP|nr:Haloacid dehalogenase/epoxide hydrolase [Corchorus capsularis]
MECVVQGIIETQYVEALEILLQGLCGVHRERLRVHEICLKSNPNIGYGISEVRLLCDLEQAEPSWTVKHVGGAMRGAGAEQISVLVRSMVESKASKNVLRLFNALGYKLDHELLRVGFTFHFRRGADITVTVSSVNKMLKLHATDEAVPVTPGIQLVEVTAPATSENYNEVVAAVSSFCEYLAPLLHLSKPGVSTGVVPTAAAAAASLMSDATLQALIFDCDGVILESEHLHRQAYNDAFAHFNVRCPPSSEPLNWDLEFYDVLQNTIGGGKPKMRWYFKEHGWPSSTIFETPPEGDEERAKLIDTLQDWKTERYKDIIKSGTVKPRPGVLRLMDEAKAAGRKLAVCSAATKSSVVLCLENLIGMDRFTGLDCFLAGDDVKEKKPDPLIYVTAAKKLGISEKDCLVVEDSVIGLQAATKAGMSCIITYTSSTADQDFSDAVAIYPDLSNVKLSDLDALLQKAVAAN